MTLARDVQKIYTEYGRLVPREVVDIVKDEPTKYPSLHHDLYEKFTDGELADQRRIDRTREIIRTIRVRRIDPRSREATRVRTYHSLPNPDGMAYQHIEQIVEDDVKTQLLLNQAKRDVDRLFDKWEGLQGFLDYVKSKVA
jgi:hypothetical protein